MSLADNKSNLIPADVAVHSPILNTPALRSSVAIRVKAPAPIDTLDQRPVGPLSPTIFREATRLPVLGEPEPVGNPLTAAQQAAQTAKAKAAAGQQLGQRALVEEAAAQTALAQGNPDLAASYYAAGQRAAQTAAAYFAAAARDAKAAAGLFTAAGDSTGAAKASANALAAVRAVKGALDNAANAAEWEARATAV